MSGGGAELRFPEERLSQGGHGHTRSNVMARVGNWQPPRKAVAPYFAGWTVLCKNARFYRHMTMTLPSRSQLASTTLVWPKGSFRPGKPGPNPPFSLVNSAVFGSARSRSRARRSGPLTARTDLEAYATRGKGE